MSCPEESRREVAVEIKVDVVKKKLNKKEREKERELEVIEFEGGNSWGMLRTICDVTRWISRLFQ